VDETVSAVLRAAVAIFGLLGSPNPPQATTVLVVQVGDATTGSFIANAQVRLPSGGRVAPTRWNGEVSFGGLAPGRYRVQVPAIGYAPGDIDLRVEGDTAAVMSTASSCRRCRPVVPMPAG
jgi:hypothetical protein